VGDDLGRRSRKGKSAVKWDAVIIGAGIGGLSSAIALASRGLTVSVVEKGAVSGGKTGTTIVDGVRLDTGPSVLTLPKVFDDVLHQAGMRLNEEVTLLEPEPAFRYFFPDGSALDIYCRLEQTLASIERALGSEPRRQMESFLEYAGRIWEAAAPVFIYGPRPTFRKVMARGWHAIRMLPRIDPFHTMEEAIGRRVRSEPLRMILWRYATYNGSDPRRAPATLNCIAHVELALGGFGVKGGIYALVEALVRAAEKLGVAFLHGVSVDQIQLADGAVRGVVLSSGERLDTPRVVANADAAQVAAILLPAGIEHGISSEQRPSMSGYTALLRARRQAGPRTAHEVVFPHDYACEFADIFERRRPPIDPTVYLCAQEKCHGIEGWPDHEPVFIMANAPALSGGDSDDTDWSRYRERVLSRLGEVGKMSADDRVVWERTPADLARAFPFSGGSIYGAASNDRNAAFKRPPNSLPRVFGLYLASGSAHPGGGLPLAALSGQTAAREALLKQPV
jgi:phytoene desaturase